MPIRMKDIARDLGVSVMTVSKVLRNHSDIGDETRKRVLQRIRELNYTPNAAARALVTGRSNVVGLIVPDLVHPFFSEIAKSLSATLRAKSYGLVIASSDDDPALERSEIEHLLARGVDALIVASVQNAGETFRRLADRGTPYILIDRNFADVRANFIGVEDELIGRMATEHLIARGCRRIAHIAGSSVSSAAGRLKGYRDALAGHGLDAPAGYVVTRDHADALGDQTGYQAMQKLLRLRPRPDGVFCINDPAAMGAMLAIVDAGLKIPADIAVIGCGDVHYGRFLRVPLTSISQNTAEMGRKAGKLAISLIESSSRPRPRTILLEPRLEPRQSTAKRPGRR